VKRKDLKMTFPRKSRYPLLRLTAVGALAALAIPTAASAWRAEPGQSGLTPTPPATSEHSQLGSQQLVQIGGQLISPSELSAWQARVHQATLPTSALVQVGGKLVKPSEVSSVQSRLGSTTTVTSSSGDGFDWSTASAGLAGFVALLGASGYLVLRTRRRTTTTTA
jgi:hypothetical protein